MFPGYIKLFEGWYFFFIIEVLIHMLCCTAGSNKLSLPLSHFHFQGQGTQCHSSKTTLKKCLRSINVAGRLKKQKRPCKEIGRHLNDIRSALINRRWVITHWLICTDVEAIMAPRDADHSSIDAGLARSSHWILSPGLAQRGEAENYHLFVVGSLSVHKC